jgi:hypothetical protein
MKKYTADPNMILPKLWVARIPQIWDKIIDEDSLPKDSKSKFSQYFNDENEKAAVKKMEDSINTEDSVIKEDMIPENTVIGSCLGTYYVTVESDDTEEVVALSDEEDNTPVAKAVVLSPETVNNKNDINILALSYDKETDVWNKVEDAEIKEDNYVWGSLTKSAPVTVFTVRKDTVLLEENDLFGGPTFVGNGVPIVISTKEDGSIIVTDARGKETPITNSTVIIAGSVDGSDLESTSVTVVGTTLNNVVKGGSYSKEKENVRVKDIKVFVKDSTLKGGVSGSGFNTKVDNLSFKIQNSKVDFMGAGESWLQSIKKDCNSKDNLGFGSKAYCKKCTMNIENSDISLLYLSGNSGYLYVDDTECTINGGSCDYIITGGSNGRTNNAKLIANDFKSQYFQTTNRGVVNHATAKFNNCTIDKFFVAGDSTDSTVNGTVDKVDIDITGGKIGLYAGTQGGKTLTTEQAKEIINTLKISRSTEVEYKENSDKILADNIRIK